MTLSEIEQLARQYKAKVELVGKKYIVTDCENKSTEYKNASDAIDAIYDITSGFTDGKYYYIKMNDEWTIGRCKINELNRCHFYIIGDSSIYFPFEFDDVKPV